jgi:predicted O-methyltransferase YrrM
MQKPARALRPEFDNFVRETLAEAGRAEGYLSPREMRFLCLLGAMPTAAGEVLEIGSFKGRSTVILARAARLAGDERISAVDPMTAPSATDPDLRGDESSLADFDANLSRAGVREFVNFHQRFSHELAPEWTRPLRLLWIDGDHTYEGTKADLDGFKPHLADGAIVAIHDVLHEFEGGSRVFLEDVLESDDFGACGFCGSIGWARYRPGGGEFANRKHALAKKLRRLLPFVTGERHVKGFSKLRYKAWRALIPHGEVDPARWLEETN